MRDAFTALTGRLSVALSGSYTERDKEQIKEIMGGENYAFNDNARVLVKATKGNFGELWKRLTSYVENMLKLGSSLPEVLIGAVRGAAGAEEAPRP